jgi:glycosyltransferase involved in cell wall biosynthesis
MKILFMGYYYPFLGAATARLSDFVQVLLIKGVEVSILSPITIRKRARWIEQSDGVSIRRFFTISPLKIPIIGGLFNVLSGFFSTFLTCLLKKPDVVIASVPPGESPLGAFWACKLLSKPLIFDVRDEWEDYRINKETSFVKLWYVIMKKVFNTVYNRGRFCVAVNEMVGDHLARRGIKRVNLLPHGLDTSLFIPRDKTETRMKLGLNPTTFVVVFAGLFQEYYRIDVVIEAIHKMVYDGGTKNVKLVVIGSGLQMKEYVRMVKKLKLTDHICFVGFIPRETMAEYLGCMDVGVIPYDNNQLWISAQPTKFYEYCSSGLPIVVSAVRDSILASYIKEWDVGLVVEPLNVDKMSQAISYLYSHNDERKGMGIKGRKKAIACFDREQITFKLLKMLSDTVQVGSIKK